MRALSPVEDRPAARGESSALEHLDMCGKCGRPWAERAGKHVACSRRSDLECAVRPQPPWENQVRLSEFRPPVGPPAVAPTGSSATIGNDRRQHSRRHARSLGRQDLLGAAEGTLARGGGRQWSAPHAVPRLIGVETVRADGKPTVFSTGNKSSRPMITACSPNDVSVVQLRRMRWAQEVSSMLSANIVSSNMTSSSVKSVCWYGHQEGSRGR